MDTRSGFHQSIMELKQELVQLGREVESQVESAVAALIAQDRAKAQALVDGDDKVDEWTMRIEERCLRLIALQQPMASDLRSIGTALKIAVDLERIADHAVDIAKVTIRLSGEPFVKPLVDIPQMAEIALGMLRTSISAYTQGDVHLASSLSEKEEEVDKLYSGVMQDVIGLMGGDRVANRQLAHLLMVAQYLERVADHATNIGEGVIFVITGRRKDLNP